MLVNDLKFYIKNLFAGGKFLFKSAPILPRELDGIGLMLVVAVLWAFKFHSFEKVLLLLNHLVI